MTTTEVRQRQGLALKARLCQERMKEAKSERDEAIREAVAAGVTLRQIAQIVGISHQRAAQIVKR